MPCVVINVIWFDREIGGCVASSECGTRDVASEVYISSFQCLSSRRSEVVEPVTLDHQTDTIFQAN